MNNLGIDLLVQKKQETDPSKLILFIKNCKNPKLTIIHSSQRNDKELKEYFEYLVKNLKTPFIGVRVTGTITPKEGYQEEAIAATILSGDIEVKVGREKIDYENPSKTAEAINKEIKNPNLCFFYASNYIKELSTIDAILRRIQKENPDTQIFGGTASPKPVTATNKGISEGEIVYATINNINCSFNMYSGFEIDKENPKEFTITKSDEYCIYEINNKNALEEYTRIQHTQPYFLNMLANLLSNPDMAILSKKLAEINPTLYGGIIKFCVEIFGTETEDNTIDPMAIFEISENKKGIITSCYRPTNTTPKKLSYTKQTQLQVYEKIIKDQQNTEFQYINPCAYTAYWFDFDYNQIHKTLQKTKTPYILMFTCGEYGTKTPYKNTTQNIVHGCNITTLNIK